MLLVRTRPTNGLLGGMTEVPTTEWSHEFAEDAALAAAPFSRPRWRQLSGHVAHTFTHFPLQLSIYTAQVPHRTAAPKGMRWVPLAGLAGEALPNVMRKVVAYAVDVDRKRR
jgi:A/G-specific adenine glycosylase